VGAFSISRRLPWWLRRRGCQTWREKKTRAKERRKVC